MKTRLTIRPYFKSYGNGVAVSAFYATLVKISTGEVLFTTESEHRQVAEDVATDVAHERFNSTITELVRL
jgi:hypothetical protein